METKICTKCRENKSLESFHKGAGKKDGYQSSCKLCRRSHYLDNWDNLATYRQVNRERILTYNMAYYRVNREAIVAQKATRRNRIATETPFLKMTRSALQNKLDKGRADLINPGEVEALYESQGGLCAYSGKPMLLGYLSQKGHPHAPSIERIDCSEAHTVYNCVLVLAYLNNARKHTDLPTFLGYLDDLEGEVAPGFIRSERLLA